MLDFMQVLEQVCALIIGPRQRQEQQDKDSISEAEEVMFFKDICQKQQNERAASTINVTHTLMNVVLKYGNRSFQGPLRMVPYFTIFKASKKGLQSSWTLQHSQDCMNPVITMMILVFHAAPRPKRDSALYRSIVNMKLCEC